MQKRQYVKNIIFLNDKALQILEILPKYGATAELHEDDLPKHKPTRAAALNLLKKYMLPVLPPIR